MQLKLQDKSGNPQRVVLPCLLRSSVATQVLNTDGFPQWSSRLSEPAASQSSHNWSSPVTITTKKTVCRVYAPSTSAPPTAGLTSYANNNISPTAIVLLLSRASFSSGNERQAPARSSDESQEARRRGLHSLSLRTGPGLRQRRHSHKTERAPAHSCPIGRFERQRQRRVR